MKSGIPFSNRWVLDPFAHHQIGHKQSVDSKLTKGIEKFKYPGNRSQFLALPSCRNLEVQSAIYSAAMLN
jgi:hypothetical protein